jgi:lipopolysaccharide biosynthesis regulator YciM
MNEYLTILGYVSIWLIIYHIFIIPRTATIAFNVWQKRLNDEKALIVEIIEPVIEIIEELLNNKFQSFFGSVSQLGQRAKELNPNSKMVEAVKSGDLYSVLAEYVANKAGVGDLTGLIEAQTKPKPTKKETSFKQM